MVDYERSAFRFRLSRGLRQSCVAAKNCAVPIWLAFKQNPRWALPAATGICGIVLMLWLLIGQLFGHEPNVVPVQVATESARSPLSPNERGRGSLLDVPVDTRCDPDAGIASSDNVSIQFESSVQPLTETVAPVVSADRSDESPSHSVSAESVALELEIQATRLPSMLPAQFGVGQVDMDEIFTVSSEMAIGSMRQMSRVGFGDDPLSAAAVVSGSAASADIERWQPFDPLRPNSGERSRQRRRMTLFAEGNTAVRGPELLLTAESPQQVADGDSFAVSFRVQNCGPADIDHVEIWLDLPENLEHRHGPSLQHPVTMLEPGASRDVRLNLQARGAGPAMIAAVVVAPGDYRKVEHIAINIAKPAATGKSNSPCWCWFWSF